MSLVGLWSKFNGDSALTMNISMTFTCQSETISQVYYIEELVMLQFKVNAEISDTKSIINYSYKLSKHDSAKRKIIKINIICKDIEYSSFDIDSPDLWSEWQPMGCKQPFQRNKLYVYNFLITAYEEKRDTLLSLLYTDTDFTDFRLSTSGGSVAVHKAYMAAHSLVFKAMLTEEWKETDEGQIDIKGATVETLQQLKDYMYLGIVPKDGLRPLLLVARLYLIEDLEKQCIRKLAESVTAEELFSLVVFACDNNIPELASTMLEITQRTVIDKAYELKKISLEEQFQIDTLDSE